MSAKHGLRWDHSINPMHDGGRLALGIGVGKVGAGWRWGGGVKWVCRELSADQDRNVTAMELNYRPRIPPIGTENCWGGGGGGVLC